MWYAKVYNHYQNTDPEAVANVEEMAQQLTNYGWTKNAICAFLGSVGWESGYNPWRWEGDVVLSINDVQLISESTVNGYGLVQFTPAGTYIYNHTAQHYSGFGPNFSDHSGIPEDGKAQISFINFLGGYYPTTAYPLTYSEFKHSNLSVDYLTEAWVFNYERPGDPWHAMQIRKDNADYWYNNFPDVKKEYPKMKWIYYLKRRRRYGR